MTELSNRVEKAMRLADYIQANRTAFIAALDTGAWDAFAQGAGESPPSDATIELTLGILEDRAKAPADPFEGIAP